MGKKGFSEEYVKEELRKMGYELKSNFHTVNSDIDVECEKGHIFTTKFKYFKDKKVKCPHCIKEEKNEMARQICEEHGYTLLSDYNRRNITVLCPRGHKIKTRLDSVKQDCCRQCANEDKYLTYEFVKSEIEKEGFKLLSKEYTGNQQKLQIQCPEGHIFEMTWAVFRLGNRCKQCTIESYKLTYEEVKSMFESEGYKLISTEYINAVTPMEIECPNDHRLFASYNSFKRGGKRCRICTPILNSKGNLEVTNILNKYNINFKPEYKFEDCKDKRALPFDFYLFDYNTCIEYDGSLHYETGYSETQEDLEDRQKKDNIKTQYCLDHNIKLIRIPYWDFKNIENILKQELNLE